MLCVTSDVCLSAVTALMIAVLSAQLMFGSTVLAVTSGSMAPTFRPGDAIIATTAIDMSTIDVGDVIVFRPLHESAVLVTHRVRSIATNANGDHSFITAGDANRTPDSEPVTVEQLIGRQTIRIPAAGQFVASLSNPSVPLLIALSALFAHLSLAIAHVADRATVRRSHQLRLRGDS